MRTLIINTYAGSLLLGADAVKGARIIGSYEDVGYGSNITKANRARFTQLEPGFEFVDAYKDWPDQDLSDTIILAHPPCAAFSQQNVSAAKRGINTDAFDCTRKVLKYGMTNNVAAMAIESVVGALGGAWDVYDDMTEKGGYFVYRILKNSLLFGVPQFRERFWAILIRKDLAEQFGVNMTWRLLPKVVPLSAAVDHLLPGTPTTQVQENIDFFVNKLVKNHGFEEAEVRAIGLAHQTGHRRTGFAQLIAPRFFPNEDHKLVCRRHISPFASAQPSILAEGGYTPVLLGSSTWVYKGVALPVEAYKAVMGFPTDYIFPGATAGHFRTFLSKGVCPPVATWILDNVRMHLGAPSATPFTAVGGYTKVVEPNRIASFRPGKNEILARLGVLQQLGSPEDDELLTLRDEEDDIEGRFDEEPAAATV